MTPRPRPRRSRSRPGAAPPRAPRRGPPLVLALASLLALAPSGIAPARAQGPDAAPERAPRVEARSVEVGGLERSWRLVVPPGGPEGRPAIVALHPRSGDGDAMRRTAGLELVPFGTGGDLPIVAYPDALQGEWAYTLGVPGYPEAPDDVPFLLAVRDALIEEGADPERIVLLGWSNGGFQAQRVACVAPGAFAAYGAVAATGYGGMPSLCPPGPADAPAVVLMHGDRDANVPWDGLRAPGPGGRPITILASAPETLAFWAGRAGCTAAEPRTDVEADGLRVALLRAGSCRPGGAAVLAARLGGGHEWPGPEAVALLLETLAQAAAAGEE